MVSTKSPGQGALIQRRGVADRIERSGDALVEFARNFCAIDTTNPPGRNYQACCEFLAEKLESIGLAARVVRVPKAEQARLAPGLDNHPRFSVIGRWDVGAKKTLHFTGHYDVVPATGGWKTDPFKPVVRGDRLIGRGSGDMKGSDTAAIFAVDALRRSGATPPWNIELSFTPDEETGGCAGLGWLVKSGQIKPDAAVLCEGGSGDNIGYAHRGVLWLNVTVLGKPGHASNPKNGVNALEKACALIGQLQGLEKVYVTRRTRFHIKQPHPTLMIGGVSGGGGKVNTIPDRFSFSIDRRMNPEDKLSDVKAEFAEVIRRARRRDPKLKVKVEYPLHVQSGWTEPTAPIARIAQAARAAVAGKVPGFRMTPGFTDMHFLTRDGKVPTIGYGAEGDGAHSDFEYVRISDLLRAFC